MIEILNFYDTFENEESSSRESINTVVDKLLTEKSIYRGKKRKSKKGKRKKSKSKKSKSRKSKSRKSKSKNAKRKKVKSKKDKSKKVKSKKDNSKKDKKRDKRKKDEEEKIRKYKDSYKTPPKRKKPVETLPKSKKKVETTFKDKKDVKDEYDESLEDGLDAKAQLSQKRNLHLKLYIRSIVANNMTILSGETEEIFKPDANEIYYDMISNHKLNYTIPYYRDANSKFKPRRFKGVFKGSIFFNKGDMIDYAYNLAKRDKRVCLLNMANNKHPGGGYLNGARAQEEQLCSRSDLYIHLRHAQKEGLYPINKNIKKLEDKDDLNLLISKNVDLYRDSRLNLLPERRNIDVVSIAVNNYKNEPSYSTLEYNEMKKTLKKAWKAVVLHTSASGYDDVILSALGAGAFNNSPYICGYELYNAIIEYGNENINYHVVVLDDHNSDENSKKMLEGMKKSKEHRSGNSKGVKDIKKVL